jgi:hypothetical protein
MPTHPDKNKPKNKQHQLVTHLLRLTALVQLLGSMDPVIHAAVTTCTPHRAARTVAENIWACVCSTEQVG